MAEARSLQSLGQDGQLPGQFLPAHMPYTLAVQLYSPLIIVIQAGNSPQEGGLACAVGADDGSAPAHGEIQGDILEDGLALD